MALSARIGIRIVKSSTATEERLALVRRVAAAAPALLFGSTALELAYPELLEHQPRDVDFLVPLESVPAIVGAIDHVWTSWEEPIDARCDLDVLRGRYYVRGRHAGRPTLDLTYESPIGWESAWARRVERDGIAIACAADLAVVYRTRAKPGDLELAARLLAVREPVGLGQ